MSELEEFLAEVVPRHQEAVDAFHSADTKLWQEHWSTADPVTLFGGVLPSKVGWEAVRDGFESVARRFKDGSGARLEVLAAEVSGDLGYLVAHEHSLGSFNGGPVVQNTLRITQIYRRESVEARSPARQQAARLAARRTIGEHRASGPNASAALLRLVQHRTSALRYRLAHPAQRPLWRC